jgi:hypothetical protein
MKLRRKQPFFGRFALDINSPRASVTSIEAAWEHMHLATSGEFAMAKTIKLSS